jgi:hypothetical protein
MRKHIKEERFIFGGGAHGFRGLNPDLAVIPLFWV